jgi:hypothetical protein
VNPFVIFAFCYSLFLKPTGQPDVSKSHYFFANIGVSFHFITIVTHFHVSFPIPFLNL